MGNNNVRAGIWVRALGIGIGLPVACVWGKPGAGLAIMVIGWVLGTILDVSYAENRAAENKKKADENAAKLDEKLRKYDKKNR